MASDATGSFSYLRQSAIRSAAGLLPTGSGASLRLVGIGYTTELVARSLFERRADERRGSIETMDELAVRQREKQRQHEAEVHQQQDAHPGAVAKHQQQDAGHAGQEQQPDERHIQLALPWIAKR